MNIEPRLRITGRGLIIQNEKLLFVSDEGTYWYLPGGKIENTETLTTCAEREVYEETGLVVKAGLLRHVLESFDIKNHLHNIHFYFEMTVLEGAISDNWNDEFGSVRFCKYFSLSEIQHNKNIVPRFLAEGKWCYPLRQPYKIYEGVVKMRGFEVVEY